MVSSSSSSSRIPIVDFSGFHDFDESSSASRHLAAQKLHEAFSTVGFCVAINHGVSTIEEVELRRCALEGFFSNDQYSVSDRCRMANGSCDAAGTEYGKTPYTYKSEKGSHLLGDLHSSRSGDLVEALSLFDLESEASFPENLPSDLKRCILNYHRKLDLFGSETLTLCAAEALGLDDPEYFRNRCRGAWGLRVAHYMECDNPYDSANSLTDQGLNAGTSTEPRLRYGAHVDSYGITLLSPDPVHWKGLQVQLPKQDLTSADPAQQVEWVDVPYVPDCLILNVGALLSEWTGGLWKAVVHRVLWNPGRRLSLVSGALQPEPEELIRMLPGLEKRDGAMEFEPILCKDFIAERMKAHS